MKIERRKFLDVLIFAVLFATFVFVSVGCASATIYVPDDYTTIQQAVNFANPDDTIIVRDDTYTENVDVNVANLTIRSENGSAPTIVQAANSDDHVFEVTADYVNISGFTVTGATGDGKSGIYINSVAHCNITDNTASNNGFGILLENSLYCNIENNTANNNTGCDVDAGEGRPSMGILLLDSGQNTLTNNSASNNTIGMLVYSEAPDAKPYFNNSIDMSNLVNGRPVYYYFDEQDLVIDGLETSHLTLAFCNNGTVKNSNISNGDGIFLRALTHSNVTNNTVSNTFFGIFLGGSQENNLTNNNLFLNRIGGILLGESSFNNIVSNNVSNNYEGGIMVAEKSDNNSITNNIASNNRYGIYIDSSSNNTIIGNTANSNTRHYGIWLWESCDNAVTDNTADLNNESGFCLDFSDNNTLTNNTAKKNNHSGIQLNFGSCHNTFTNNTVNYNSASGIHLEDSSNYNTITNNTAKENSPCGIYLDSSSNNTIYNNYFDNTNNAYDTGNNIWNISQTSGTNIVGGSWLGGNYWSDYAGVDADRDGLGDTLLPYNSSGAIQNGGDWLPLVKAAAPSVFDTGKGTYPSIMGTHNGTIIPLDNISINKLYTYPCPGTGGHTKSIEIYDNVTLIANGTWNGYVGDWHNITLHNLTGGFPYVTLLKDHEYRYIIETGSYPQIIHAESKEVTGGTITCTSFEDANGVVHYDWIPAIRIPAIRLEVEEIKIGIVAPLTGGASTTGNDMWQAAVLAADEINAQGGVSVNGVNMKITLVKGDTETSSEGGVKAVTKLITEDEVDILVGGFSSGITYADQVVASEHNVPFIITGASSPEVTRRTDIDTSYFFHHCPTTDDVPESTLLFVDEEVRPLINERFDFSENRTLRLGVLYQDSRYGEGIYEGINNTIEEHNLSMVVVVAEKFTTGETNYTSVLTTIKAAEPDVVYPAALFLDEQTLIVAQGRRDVSLNTTYLSVECNDDPNYYTGVERWGEYSIQESRFSPYAIPSGPIHSAVVEFREDYESKWGAPPCMMGASTYEGVYIAAEAAKNAGTLDKDKVRASLTEIEMPQIVELMKDDVITFSPDYRESKFELYMQQLIWNETANETRPKIVWPEGINETDFVLPDWYEPGSP